MSYYDELITNAVTIATQLKNEKTKSFTTLTHVDKQVNHCYHILELLPLNAAETAKVMKKLKGLLVQRRELKEQISQLDSMLGSRLHEVKIDTERASDRTKKYTNEALQMYKSIFGVVKTIKKAV